MNKETFNYLVKGLTLASILFVARSEYQSNGIQERILVITSNTDRNVSELSIALKECRAIADANTNGLGVVEWRVSALEEKWRNMGQNGE